MLLLLKNLIDNSLKTFLSILRVIFLSKFFVSIPKSVKKEIVILGNGPSFKNDYYTCKSFLLDKELICVNHFPSSDFYTDLKPKYYIISAPDLWLDNIDQKFIDGSNHLFENLAQKTSWDLTFFVPFEAKKHLRWQNIFKENKYINIIWYNNIAVEGFNFFKHCLYRFNLGMPRPHNIMIPSMMISIALGFKKIYLWGADHSWLPEISVTDDNEVLIHQKHFYDENTSSAQPLDKRGKGKRKLHEVLHKFMTAFEGYFTINDYAKTLQVKIFNTTKGSFIDAFKRLPLTNFNSQEQYKKIK